MTVLTSYAKEGGMKRYLLRRWWFRLSKKRDSLQTSWKGGEKMQEEVENRTLTLVVSGTKFTGRLLKAAISKYMAHCKEKKLQKQRSRTLL